MGSTSIQAAPPAPAPVDPTKSSLDYINAMADPALQQKLYDAEAQFRPQYTALNLQDINNYMQGVGGQPGALQQYADATQAATGVQTQANTALRQADINDVANLGGQASAAFRAANPEMYAQLGRAQGMAGQSNYFQGLENAVGGPLAQQLMGQAQGAGPSAISQALQQNVLKNLTSDGSLTAAEQRDLTQGVREGYAARGTEMGAGAIGAEALARLSGQRNRMLENLNIGMGVNQQLLAEQDSNRSFQMGVQGQNVSNYGMLGQAQQGQSAADRAYALQLAQAYGQSSFDPMMAILGRSSTAPQAGQQQQGYSANLMSSLQGPQLFDPNAGINLGLQNAANLGNYQASTYGAQSAAAGAASGGKSAGIGSAIGGIGMGVAVVF